MIRVLPTKIIVNYTYFLDQRCQPDRNFTGGELGHTRGQGQYEGTESQELGYTRGQGQFKGTVSQELGYTRGQGQL